MKTMPYNLAYNSTTQLPSSLQNAVSYSKSMQSTYDTISLALESGKVVNSSYDNSTLYFKDMRLSDRAAGLNSVLDGISGMVTTLDSTQKAIESLNNLVKQAKASAQYAAESVNKPAKIVGEYGLKEEQILGDIGGINVGDSLVIRTGDALRMESPLNVEKTMRLSELGIATGDTFNIKLGDGEWVSVTAHENMRIDAFMGQLTEKVGSDKLKYEIKDGKLALYTVDRSPIVVGDQRYDSRTGEIDETNTTPNIASKLGLDLGTTVTLQAGQSVQDFMDQISAIEGVNATLTSRGKLQITTDQGDDIVVSDRSGKMGKFMGIQGYSEDGINARKNYANQYNIILQQIDDLVTDSRYNGLNLLAGDQIIAVFDEEGKTQRTIHGVKLDTASLGLKPAVDEWKNPQDITNALDDIDIGSLKVRRASNKFQQDNQMVQSREVFLKGLGDTFLTGAEFLTKADLNEVASLLLAIKTQQDIAAEITSITLDTNSRILSMF